MDKIKQWLVGEMDYSEGVKIFSEFSGNKFLIRSLQSSHASGKKETLTYEMKKLLGIPLSLLFNQKCSNEELLNIFYKQKKTAALRHPAKKITETKKKIPPIILTAKQIVFDLYKKIDIIHSRLYELGTSNNPDIVKKRKHSLDKRIPLIRRCEKIYILKEQYFITNEIDPELPALIKLDIEDIELEPIVNTNYNELTDIELMRRNTNISSSITKLKNRLNYQDIVKRPETNPMPEGPKKEKIKRKLDILLKEQKLIVTIIKRRK